MYCCLMFALSLMVWPKGQYDRHLLFWDIITKLPISKFLYLWTTLFICLVTNTLFYKSFPKLSWVWLYSLTFFSQSNIVMAEVILSSLKSRGIKMWSFFIMKLFLVNASKLLGLLLLDNNGLLFGKVK